MTKTNSLDTKEYEALLGRAQKGDTDAFESLYTGLYTPIYRYVFVRLQGYAAQKQLAEDITQEAFLKLFSNIRAGKMNEFKGTFIGYAFTVARNLIIDHSRKKKEDLLKAEEETFDDFQSDTLSPEEETHIKHMGQKIFTHIENLPDAMREVIVFSFVHQYTTEEIALILSKSEEAIRQLKSRGIHRLRYTMRGQYEDSM